MTAVYGPMTSCVDMGVTGSHACISIYPNQVLNGLFAPSATIIH